MQLQSYDIETFKVTPSIEWWYVAEFSEMTPFYKPICVKISCDVVNIAHE